MRPHSLFRLACLLVLGLSMTLPVQAARVALVIGNASYEDRPLKNPVNDAQDLATALTNAGFKVTFKQNLSADGMKEAISEFGDTLRRENDAGLFYFSGHGVQTSKGNYLLPVGRAFKREKDVELFAVEARSVLSEMQQARNPLNILILDACRDSPLPSAEKSAGSKGLARMDAPSGSVIAFATAPGKTASDNTSGRNGLYTKHLITAINTPGLRLEDVFKRVGAAVEKESAQQGGDQSPEEVMKLRSELPFYFKTGNAPAANAVQLASLKLEPVQNAKPATIDEDQEAWDMAKRTHSLASYQTYLDNNPQGRYAKLARQALKGMQPVAPDPVAPPAASTPLIDNRYQVLANGSEIKDRQTGLVWQRCSVGQSWKGSTCAGEANTFTFDNAQKQAGNGWRVPTVRELHSLVWCSSGKTKDRTDLQDGKAALENGCDGEYTRPTIRQAAFPNTPDSWYWTSTPKASFTWYVGFGSGDVNVSYRSNDFHVRLVR